MSDELKIKAKADGVEVESKGGATSRLLNAILDLGSPFTETAGLVGDFVKTYREENAVRALQRIKTISEENSDEIGPPEPKFLIDWIEAVSLEENDELVTMWAQLFVSEAKVSKRSHYLFKRILKELSLYEAALLTRLAERQQSTQTYVFADDAELVWNSLSNPKNPGNPLNFEGSFADSKSLTRFLFEALERPGIKLECVDVGQYTDDPTWGLSEIYHSGQIRKFLRSSDDYESLGVLGSLGLIGRATKSFVRAPHQDSYGRGLVLDLHGSYLTPLGDSFLNTVKPNRAEWI